MKVGIPAEFVERLKINSESDGCLSVLAEMRWGLYILWNLREIRKKIEDQQLEIEILRILNDSRKL